MSNSSVSITAMTASQSSHHVPSEERDGEIAKALSMLLAKNADRNLLPEPAGPATGRDAGGILLLGPAGAGKTTGVHHALDSMPVLTDPVTGAPRYLKVQAPDPATPKRLCLEILAATGMYVNDITMPLWRALEAVRARLAARQTVVLFIDEAQNLFADRKPRAVEDMRKVLYSLMGGPSGVILIMAGTEGLAACTRDAPWFSEHLIGITLPERHPGIGDGLTGHVALLHAAKPDLDASLPESTTSTIEAMWAVSVRKPGHEALRPLDQVEIDEFQVDLSNLLVWSGCLECLTEEQRACLGLENRKVSWRLSIAVDRRTRVILGMSLRQDSAEAVTECLRMIGRDKGEIVAPGGVFCWSQYGKPKMVVADQGPAFHSAQFADACAEMGIAVMLHDGGRSFSPALTERVFAMCGPVTRSNLSGRVFPDPIHRSGEVRADAGISANDLADSFVRWIVGIYHNTPNSALEGRTPIKQWDLDHVAADSR